MEITTRTSDGVTVIAFNGSLDTTTAPEAQEAFDEIVDGGSRKVVVDFTDVDYIASSGLRVLLVTAKRLGGEGGSLRMFGLNESVEEVFTISGFSTVFDVFSTESEALDGL